MDDDISSRRCLLYDYGNSIALARRLAREFGKVDYFCPWKDSLPQSVRLAVGTGFPEIERVRHFHDAIHKADLIIFTDIYDSDIQHDLINRGKRVWGSGRGDRLEYDRPYFLKALETAELPVVPYRVCEGVDELEKYLKRTVNKWVKLNLRGDDETWNHITWDNFSERKVESYCHRWGPIANDIIFTVVDHIDSVVEAAYDGFHITSPEGKSLWPETGFLGYEDKNKSHILTAIPYASFPGAVREVNDGFAPMLASYYVRSGFGTEIKVVQEGRKQVNHFIDLTARQPDPPGPIIMEMVKNLGKFFWHGSVGELIPLEIEELFGVQVNLYSSISQSNWSAVEVPEEYDPFVKLSRCCMRGGVTQIIPEREVSESYGGTEQIGCVVATGNKIEDAIDEAKEICQQITAMGLTAETDSLAECLRRIKEGQEEHGIAFTDEPIPEPETVVAGNGE